MKKGFVFAALVVCAVVIVATATAGKPGNPVPSPLLQASNNGLVAANGKQAIVSGTYECGVGASTFNVSVFLSQGSGATSGGGSSSFTCSDPGVHSAWTIVINADVGRYATGKAFATVTAQDQATSITGTDQLSLSSSTEGVLVPVGGP